MRAPVPRLAALLLLGISTTAAAQRRVVLELRPRVGDTLVTRLEQQAELTGTQQVNGASQSTSMQTTFKVFSRAIVESSVLSGTTILAITDSASVVTSDGRGKGVPDPTGRVMSGQQVRMRIAPDGSPAMSDDMRSSKQMSEVVAFIPATFPKTAVAVGETWVREMVVPAGTAQFGAPLAGRVRATFRLDSIGRNGYLAFVSMSGQIRPDAGDRPAGVAVVESGTISGTMTVDRARGWISESQVTVVAHSSVTPPARSGAAAMTFRMRVTQRTRTLDKP